MLKRVDGVIHVTSPLGGYDPNEAIPAVVASVMNALRSAAKEPTVRSFIYTSSSWAAMSPAANVEATIGPESWKEKAVQEAWTPPYSQDRYLTVYAAGKTQAEQAAWKYVEEHHPVFAFSTGVSHKS